jgi:transcription elongation GreA/GreB family factor
MVASTARGSHRCRSGVHVKTGRTVVQEVRVPVTAVEALEGGGNEAGFRTRRQLGAAVDVGSRVRVLAPWGEDEYLIASPYAANPPRGCISILSPVGAALLGQRLGAEVSVQTPGGVQSLTILGVVPHDAERSSL